MADLIGHQATLSNLLAGRLFHATGDETIARSSGRDPQVTYSSQSFLQDIKSNALDVLSQRRWLRT